MRWDVTILSMLLSDFKIKTYEIFFGISFCGCLRGLFAKI